MYLVYLVSVEGSVYQIFDQENFSFAGFDFASKNFRLNSVSKGADRFVRKSL